MPVKKAETRPIDIAVVSRGSMEICLLGVTPFICNRLNVKARQELLLPAKKGKKIDKELRLKHDPLPEYRMSPYIDEDPKGPTYIQLVAAGVKMAAASVPLDIPDTGTSKAQLGRLLFAQEEKAPVWGVPQMLMAPVRQAGIDRTPDIRTRAIIPRWASKVTITYVQPVLTAAIVTKLLACAGFMRGIGDWRAEKGSGNYGSFELVDPKDPRFLSIIKHGGREAQIAAMETPEYYDRETRELYQWYLKERAMRSFDDAAREKLDNNKKKRKTTSDSSSSEAEL